LIQQAEKNLSEKKYLEAAALFEKAGRLQSSQPLYLFKAGVYYLQIRDYVNASNCYQAIRDDSRFPMAGMKYARCLKNQGRYEEASTAFEIAAQNYKGEQKEIFYPVITNEIAGCELAIQLAQNQEAGLFPNIQRLPAPIASENNEFAPLPFSDTLMYFCQVDNAVTKFMRAVKKNDGWSSVKQATGLPEEAANGFVNGCFSPDGQRFYFSRGELAPEARIGGSAEETFSELFVLRRQRSGAWSEPERLRDYINMKGTSTQWPFVTVNGEEEWLFFASDRAGGMGGKDLYFCKRPIYSDDMDFSFPMNLGNQVNSGADETTPFYDVFTNTLWFSTIGHPSLGGYDVFFSSGSGTHWQKPVNAGTPINSSADDYYFTLKRDGKGAYLVSNRPFGEAKQSTLDDDLFELWKSDSN
jgi:hypothetical protein